MLGFQRKVGASSSTCTTTTPPLPPLDIPEHSPTMSVPSLAPYIMKRPWLQRWMKPLSQWYFDNAGYRKLGLRYVLENKSNG